MAATLKGADQNFAASVDKLMKEKGVTLTSGFRSNQEQQGLYDAALKKYGSEQEARKWAAKPGGSNHEHGIAADIGNYQNISDTELAAYGLYRPMSWEPWHVEPIGSRSKAGKAAYTTPTVDNATASVLEKFSEAVKSLDVGAASSTVGAAGSSVGATESMVGAEGSNIEDMGGSTTEKADASAASDTGGNVISGGQPANESAYAPLFNAAGAKYGINPKILQEVARAESGFNLNAGSGAGAKGLMQFMPGTAKGIGIDPMDPAQAVDGAARLLSGYLEQYGGDLPKALAAYNAGPGAVKQYGGVPPYKETQEYVKKITAKVNS